MTRIRPIRLFAAAAVALVAVALAACGGNNDTST
jgi:hypothetical protein